MPFVCVCVGGGGDIFFSQERGGVVCLDGRENQSIPPKRKNPSKWRRFWLIIRDEALSQIRYYLVVIPQR